MRKTSLHWCWTFSWAKWVLYMWYYWNFCLVLVKILPSLHCFRAGGSGVVWTLSWSDCILCMIRISRFLLFSFFWVHLPFIWVNKTFNQRHSLLTEDMQKSQSNRIGYDLWTESVATEMKENWMPIRRLDICGPSIMLLLIWDEDWCWYQLKINSCD